MSQAYWLKDQINPFQQLNSRDIQRINHRLTSLKEKLFRKDKVIQDKIQQIHALTFFHKEQIDLVNDSMAQKDQKIDLLTKKCEKLERNYKDLLNWLNKLNELLDRFEKWNQEREKDEDKKLYGDAEIKNTLLYITKQEKSLQDIENIKEEINKDYFENDNKEKNTFILSHGSS